MAEKRRYKDNYTRADPVDKPGALPPVEPADGVPGDTGAFLDRESMPRHLTRRRNSRWGAGCYFAARKLGFVLGGSVTPFAVTSALHSAVVKLDARNGQPDS